eukprot:6206991-Pleurochrysis_carterae.AAC.1
MWVLKGLAEDNIFNVLTSDIHSDVQSEIKAYACQTLERLMHNSNASAAPPGQDSPQQPPPSQPVDQDAVNLHVVKPPLSAAAHVHDDFQPPATPPNPPARRNIRRIPSSNQITWAALRSLCKLRRGWKY